MGGIPDGTFIEKLMGGAPDGTFMENYYYSILHRKEPYKFWGPVYV